MDVHVARETSIELGIFHRKQTHYDAQFRNRKNIHLTYFNVVDLFLQGKVKLRIRGRISSKGIWKSKPAVMGRFPFMGTSGQQIFVPGRVVPPSLQGAWRIKSCRSFSLISPSNTNISQST